MKINSTLGLLLILIVVVAGTTIVSGIKGYIVGYEALKTVSQPNTKPNQQQFTNQNSNQFDLDSEDGFFQESEILEQVNEKIERNQKYSNPLQGDSKEGENKETFIESQ